MFRLKFVKINGRRIPWSDVDRIDCERINIPWKLTEFHETEEQLRKCEMLGVERRVFLKDGTKEIDIIKYVTRSF